MLIIHLYSAKLKKGALPMLNGILTALLIFSVVTAAFTGRIEALSAAALSGCGEAVKPGHCPHRHAVPVAAA